MPKIKVHADGDWIDDPILVADFCKRLQDAIDSSAEFDRDIANNILAIAQQGRHYSQRMSWYLAGLEDQVELSSNPSNLWDYTGGFSGRTDRGDSS
jgi:hypothetical protein